MMRLLLSVALRDRLSGYHRLGWSGLTVRRCPGHPSGSVRMLVAVRAVHLRRFEYYRIMVVHVSAESPRWGTVLTARGVQGGQRARLAWGRVG